MNGKLYIGTYTTDGSKGIYACDYLPETGELKHCCLIAEAENPSYLALSDDGQTLYAVNELDSYEGKPGSALSVYSKTGDAWTLRQILPTHGASTCHVTIGARDVCTANYNGGSWTRFQMQGDGTLLAELPVACTGGDGAVSHAHYTAYDRRGRLWVADLGLDCIFVYDMAGEGAELVASIDMPAGYGPRHLVFHPTLPIVYAVQELASRVTVISLDGEGKPLAIVQSMRTLPVDFSGESFCAAIKMDADGRFLYVSNRGHDSVTVYAIDRQTGVLLFRQIQSSGGEYPRDISLSPDGRWLYCANQTAGGITRCAVCSDTGKLGEPQPVLSLSKPVCLIFE